MDPTQELLDAYTSYVPQLLTDRIATNPALHTAPARSELPAAVLFADIAGFTALAEQFARRGPSGVEELTAVLNAAVGPLIACIHEHGGDVVKFAGDALLAIWPATDQPLEEATLRAARCGLALPSAVGGRGVALRVGIGAGLVTTMQLGGMRGRWELLLAGAPLVQIRVAALQAEPGDVVATAEAWALIRDRTIGRVLPAGVRLQSAEATRPASAAHRPRLTPRHLAALETFIPGAVRARLHQPDGWLAELRRVTVLFVRMPNLHAGTPLDRAQALVGAVQTQLYLYEGSLNKLSVDDKGAALLCAFGLPPLAHADDPRRALQAALAIGAALEQQGARYAIGITTGQAFCGEVGSALRREYTMIGDTVNLAARLMSAAQARAALKAPAAEQVPTAPDRPILCDSATAQASDHSTLCEALPPIVVKGKTAPIAVFHPQRRASIALGAAGRLVGRAAERTAIERQIAALLRGPSAEITDRASAATLVFEGEAGMGKSRLVGELARQARETGALVLLGATDPSQQTTPLYAWRPIIAALLALDPQAEGAARAAQTLAALAVAPDMLALAPLLNPVLGLELPESERTRPLAGVRRAEQTRALLLRLVLASARLTPMVLILEDAHWLDTASWALALAVSRSPGPLLLALAARPVPREIEAHARASAQVYRDLLAQPATERLVLEGLSSPETLALLRQSLGAQHIPQAVAERVAGRAQGNPYFAQELAYAMRDAGLITVEDGQCRIAPDAGAPQTWQIPDSVQSAITSRIDRLTPKQQLTLKVASVIGRTFPVRLLRMLDPLARDAQLDEHLHTLAELDITPQNAPDPDRAYIFKHAITQEVIYGMLLFAQRRQLHRQVGEALETLHTDQVLPVQDLLGDHFWRAGLWERAVFYLTRAGDAALQLHAYTEARVHYARVLEALGKLPDSPARRRERAAVLIKQVTVSLVSDGPETNLARLVEADQLLGPLPADAARDGEDLRRRYDLAYALGRSSYYFTRPRQAIHHFEQMRSIAQMLRQPDLEVVPTSMVGRVRSLQGFFGEALPLIEQAFPALERTGNWSDWIWNQAYVGFSRAALGEYADGEAEAQLAVAAARQHHHQAAEVVGQLFLSMTHWQGGRLAEAVDTIDRTIALASAAGELMPLHLAHGFRAWTLARAGRHSEAEASWREYAALVGQLGGRLVYADWFMAAQAELALLRGDSAAALELARGAVAFAQEVEGVFAEGIARRVWAAALAHAGAPSTEVEAQLQASAAAFQAGSAGAELGRMDLGMPQPPALSP
ncbi:MAG TPA: adenylate/guanylate cyclase domain-containing protein [Roseiflexaceae bacterium]|nr:adenylate/guanylate cyclase domain-containing protein [Roseiflexaceae bacterium]